MVAPHSSTSASKTKRWSSLLLTCASTNFKVGWDLKWTKKNWRAAAHGPFCIVFVFFSLIPFWIWEIDEMSARGYPPFKQQYDWEMELWIEVAKLLGPLAFLWTNWEETCKFLVEYHLTTAVEIFKISAILVLFPSREMPFVSFSTVVLLLGSLEKTPNPTHPHPRPMTPSLSINASSNLGVWASSVDQNFQNHGENSMYKVLHVVFEGLRLPSSGDSWKMGPFKRHWFPVCTRPGLVSTSTNVGERVDTSFNPPLWQ